MELPTAKNKLGPESFSSSGRSDVSRISYETRIPILSKDIMCD